jgi:uncharacterized protein (TIGR00266 family)
MSKDVINKYRSFVTDHNDGMRRRELCSKYQIPEEKFESFLTFLKRKGFTLSTVTMDDYPEFQTAHDIDFEIFGEDMQFVEVELDPHETAIAEAGAMMYMDAGISMETIFGDGSDKSQGVMDKIFGAGKRILTGESLFMTAFTNTGYGKQRVAFAPDYPGKIVAMDLDNLGGQIICQKDAFLCAAKGVSIGIAFQKKLGVGFFGGEGFILQRLTGNGLAFVHAGGMIVERELEAAQKIKVDTGCIVAMEKTVNYDIEYVGNIKSAVFGGEGIFLATLVGPGRVWLQSLPMSRLAARLGTGQKEGGFKWDFGSNN